MTAELMEHIRARVIFAVDKESEDGFISALLRHRIPACLRRDEEDGRLIAEISPKFTKKILSVLDNLSLKVYIINIKGFPALLPFLRHRIGAVLGVILFFALIWLSSLFVWRVEVVGTQRVPMETLVSGLRELGVGEGSRISGIDAYAVSNALLAAHPELSWTSIDITGTTVTLTVRETVVGEKDEIGATSLMVASEDGVVESVLVYSGVAAVKPGCVVRAGDVLISGFISGSGLQYEDTPTLRVGKASGSVRAIVERSVTEYVPLHETVATDMGEGSSVQR
ncbi:MAG: sporulation protein YqfD [Clostridia bacterium]|nr:sporulation protein YqfD [Clostridia bacterium]